MGPSLGDLAAVSQFCGKGEGLAVSDVIVYIDGFNLYYGVSSARHTSGSTSRPTDQQIYLRALRTIPTLSITYGHFLTHSVSMRLTGVTPTKRVWVDKTEEKGSDVNLASHLIRDACKQAFQTAVLITNDSDLAEPVRIVRDELNLPVGILNPHPQHSTELKRVATFLKRVRQSHLITSQFPEVLSDSKGMIRKPSSW